MALQRRQMAEQYKVSFSQESRLPLTGNALGDVSQSFKCTILTSYSPNYQNGSSGTIQSSLNVQHTSFGS